MFVPFLIKAQRQFGNDELTNTYTLKYFPKDRELEGLKQALTFYIKPKS